MKKLFWILAIPFLAAGQVTERKWSLDATLFSPATDIILNGIGANLVYHFRPNFGLGTILNWAGPGSYSPRNVGGTHYELGIRAKYFAFEVGKGGRLVLSPTAIGVYGDAFGAEQHSLGLRLGLDISFEQQITELFFIGAGGGAGIYAIRPSFYFRGDRMVPENHSLFQLMAQAGIRL